MDIQKRKDFLVNLAFFLVIAILILAISKFAFSYLMPFIIGVIIAYIMQKPAIFISEKIKITKGVCAAVLSVISYILILAVISVILWIIIANIQKIMHLFSSVADNFADGVEKIKNIFNSYFDAYFNKANFDFNYFFNDTTIGFSQKISQGISNGITNIIKNLPSFFVSSIVTVIANCYIAKEFDVLVRFFKNLFSRQICENISVIKEIFINCILKFLTSYLLLMAITFAQLFIGLLLLNMDNAFVIALLISVVDLLPILGTGIILLPWAVILFLQGNTLTGVGVVILYLVICIVRNILEPKIVSKQIGFNPLFTLIALFLGYKIAGAIGLILMPLTVIIIFSFYKRQLIEDNEST